MKRLFIFLVFIFASSLFAQGPNGFRPLRWDSGVATDTLGVGTDTSDTFKVFTRYKANGYTKERSPISIHWLMSAIGIGAGDSVNVTFYVDWSNDQVIWIPDTIGAIPDVVTAAGTMTSLGLKMTDNVQALYGRVRAVVTGADTVSVGGSFLKVFNE